MLIEASEHNDPETARLLLEAGANVEAIDWEVSLMCNGQLESKCMPQNNIHPHFTFFFILVEGWLHTTHEGLKERSHGHRRNSSESRRGLRSER